MIKLFFNFLSLFCKKNLILKIHENEKLIQIMGIVGDGKVRKMAKIASFVSCGCLLKCLIRIFAIFPAMFRSFTVF